MLKELDRLLFIFCIFDLHGVTQPPQINDSESKFCINLKCHLRKIHVISGHKTLESIIFMIPLKLNKFDGGLKPYS